MAASTLQSLLPRILTWPEEDQQALVNAALQIEAAREEPYVLTPEEERDVLEALAEAERGDFATDEEVAALLGRFAGK